MKAPKFSEVEARVRDAERVRAIRAEAERKIEVQFAPAKKRAADNAARMNSLRGYLAPW